MIKVIQERDGSYSVSPEDFDAFTKGTESSDRGVPIVVFEISEAKGPAVKRKAGDVVTVDHRRFEIVGSNAKTIAVRKLPVAG